MAVFRCLQSGHTVEFTLPYDIDSMRGHNGYVRVDEVVEHSEDANEERTDTSFTPVNAKPKGRPRKVNG